MDITIMKYIVIHMDPLHPDYVIMLANFKTLFKKVSIQLLDFKSYAYEKKQ